MPKLFSSKTELSSDTDDPAHHHPRQLAHEGDRRLEAQSGSSKRRPARAPAVLAAQLVRELRRLEEESIDAEARADALQLLRAYLLQAHTLAWLGVHRGQLLAPRTVLVALREARPFVDRFIPDLDDKQQIATELEGTFLAFIAADRALERVREEARLADAEVSRNERAVLEVLSSVEDDRLLRRNQVFERMPEPRPTLARVGQLLKDLHAKGYLTRMHASAQGNARTAFYGLSSLGRRLCETTQIRPWFNRQLNLEDPRLKTIALDALDASISQYISENLKRVAFGMLCKISLHQTSSADEVLRALYDRTVGFEDEADAFPVRAAFRQLAQSGIGAGVLQRVERGRGCFRLTRPSRWPQVEKYIGAGIETLSAAHPEPQAPRAESTVVTPEPSDYDLLKGWIQSMDEAPEPTLARI